MRVCVSKERFRTCQVGSGQSRQRVGRGIGVCMYVYDMWAGSWVGSDSLRSAHCRSATSSTLTAQQFGVAEAPLQRRDAWRLALPAKAGTAVVREALARKAATMVVVVVKCMVGGFLGVWVAGGIGNGWGWLGSRLIGIDCVSDGSVWDGMGGRNVGIWVVLYRYLLRGKICLGLAVMGGT